MARFQRGRRTLREQRIASNSAQSFYAAMLPADDPRRAEHLERLERERAAVKPKRVRRPRTVADGPSEHQEQAAVIKWWWLNCKRYGLPHFALFAIPNGGARDSITGARLKAEGVRPGVYDLMLAKDKSVRNENREGYGSTIAISHGLFIEMKVGDNKPSPAQVEFGEYLARANYSTAVCYSAAEAINALEIYLA